MKRRLYRCSNCAEGPAPTDLPALIVRSAPVVPMQPLRAAVNDLPFDYKSAQVGREPGEDD
ncbi:MAG: hypothetical protein ABI665_09340 [Vicinamibacterales bacterium]